MTSKTIANGILRALSVGIGVVVLIYFLYQIRSVLVYVAIAGVVSLMGRPIVLFLRRRLKFNNGVAVVCTMLLFVLFFFGLFSLFVPLIKKQGEALSLLNVNELQQKAVNLYRQVAEYLHNHEINIQHTISESGLMSSIDFDAIPNFFNSALGALGSFTIGLFSVLFISFFFLKDSRLLEGGILIFMPKDKEQRFKRSMDTIKDLLSRYFVGLLFQILILFIIYTGVLLIIGVENALVIAFLCALLNLIPYVGPLVGGILMMLLTMTNYLGLEFQSVILPKTLWAFVGFVIGQLVDNFFSQPVIFSKSVKSHPLEIFLVILIAGILFGVAGLIVAIPAYTAIKVILKEFLAHNKIVQSLTKNL